MRVGELFRWKHNARPGQVVAAPFVTLRARKSPLRGWELHPWFGPDASGQPCPVSYGVLGARASAGEPIIDLTDSWLQRVRIDGHHLHLGGEPFRVRGVTYGSFLPRRDGQPFPESQQIKDDIAAMRALGLNVLRTYATPPPDLVEIAGDLGMWLIVGLHHHDWRMETEAGRRARRRVLDAGLRAVDEALDVCAYNPTVLALAVGNEIPSELVRVHGIASVEDTLSTMVAAAHDGCDDLLVTYVSFPTTEYLEVEGADIVSFNVFLEQPETLKKYLRHLHTVARGRPVLVSELGLASGVHGAAAQATSLEWQLRLVDETGCAGATVFSWTDEWGVAGAPVTGWGFGITDEERTPKPACTVVEQWARRSVSDLRREWPKVSVVVCAYNEERVLDACLASLAACDYPALEVIICDDGSTDDTAAIAERYPFRVLRLPHGGLSRARNAGCEAATGEIVAYLDADAYCHREWPYHLALSLEDPGVVATGGPNLPVPDAGFAERAVAASPGGPLEVLVGDDRAEHVPGCNMAFERDALIAAGGFDETYTSAGDDVDICWRLLDAGGEIGFAPAAQIRHHRRASVRAYLRQQRNYGRSERMVATRHRHRFNRLGQAKWSGFLYGGQRLMPSLLRPVVYHGYQGHAPFQTVVSRRAEEALGLAAAVLPLTVPLFVLGVVLAVLNPAAWAIAAAVLVLVAGYAAAVFAAFRPHRSEPEPRRLRAVVAWLHVAQPIVRAWGRLRATDLGPRPSAPTEAWTGDRAAWLRAIERHLFGAGLAVKVGGPTDAWDIEASRLSLVGWRITTAVAWSWTPIARVRMRPRRVLLVLATLAGVAAGQFGALPLLGLGLLAALDALVGARACDRAIRATAAGSRGSGTSVELEGRELVDHVA